MLTEYWTWWFHENPNAQIDEDEEFDLDDVLATINREGEEEEWEEVPADVPEH